jgi:hypothetical protein
MRAERCRERPEECMQLAQSAADPAVITNYLQMAENYLVVAPAEI